MKDAYRSLKLNSACVLVDLSEKRRVIQSKSVHKIKKGVDINVNE
jgi:hypothetical protein